MKNTVMKVLAIASVVSAAAAFAQAAKTAPTTATYIMKEDLDKISKTEQSQSTRDENAKVIDLGYENFTVGIIHRGSTRTPAPAGGGGGAAAQAPACGRTMATLPPGGTPGGITHDFQTEGYLITSGGGTMFTDGYIVNGRHNPSPDLNGPTCGGMAYEVVKKAVKPGDIIIIPAGVVHGWLDIPEHVDYLSFRPSPGILSAGWVHPVLKK